eukprot:TRINITY_DN1201_c0_g1_i1.p1 TRINITY_DN1201_c0_g1~~TRINITY_DN1201_c0_g1_i1.p1  ORF type:complete len:525 (+),score=107.45 TRINITY_DN1201_c0_g1_i1:119-1693(+)
MVVTTSGSSSVTTTTTTTGSPTWRRGMPFVFKWLALVILSLSCVYGLHLAFLRLPRLLSVSNRINEMMNERHVVDAAALALQEEWESLSCDVKALYSREQKLLSRIESLSKQHSRQVKSDGKESRDPPLKVFVAIMSGFANKETRQLIRETWASEKLLRDNQWATIKFALADTKFENDTTLLQQLRDEEKEKGDLIFFEGVKDHYLTLSDRLEVMVRKITLDFEFDYFLKTDDDTYIHLSHLYSVLHYLPRTKIYWGEMVKSGKVITQADRLWHNPEYLKLNIHYAIYALGAGYIVSRDIMEWLLFSPLRFKVWRAEDAQMGTWLSPLQITVNNTFRRGEIWHSRCEICPCDSKKTILLHGLMGEEAFRACHKAHQEDDLCNCIATVKAQFREVRDVKNSNRYDGGVRRTRRTSAPTYQLSSNWLYLTLAISFLVFCLALGLVCACALNYCDKQAKRKKDDTGAEEEEEEESLIEKFEGFSSSDEDRDDFMLANQGFRSAYRLSEYRRRVRNGESSDSDSDSDY